jgi:hypothetical protein
MVRSVLEDWSPTKSKAGQGFGQIGALRGGHAKIMGNAIDSPWDGALCSIAVRTLTRLAEIALAHYPSIDHFVRLLEPASFANFMTVRHARRRGLPRHQQQVATTRTEGHASDLYPRAGPQRQRGETLNLVFI